MAKLKEGSIIKKTSGDELIATEEYVDQQGFGTYFINGNIGGTSGTWLGTHPNISSYFSGLVVAYFINTAGASGTTLNINGLGAKPVLTKATTALETTYAVGQTVFLVYEDVDGGRFRLVNFSDTNNYDRLYRNNAITISHDTLYRYKLIGQTVGGTWAPMMLTNKTGTGVVNPYNVSTQEFLIGGEVLVYGTTTNVTPGDTVSNLYSDRADAYVIGYSLNVASVTTGKFIYLKGSLGPNGGFIIEPTNFVAQDLPNSEDGKLYMLLGYAYSTTAMRFIGLHPVFEYVDGKVRQFVPEHTHPDIINYIDQEILGISLTPGPKGEDGRTWHVGTAVPSNATGVIGDLYLNRSTWIVYEKTGATTWTNRGNIKGDTGATGSDGKTWYSGSEAPANGTGVIGDFYLRTSNWTIYEKTGAAAWTSQGSIKGADGVQGSQGIPGTDGVKGDTGDTWKPTVSAAGDLTWAKDSGATTPTARNIKGPQGNIGATGDTWKPAVDTSGNLTWSKDSSSTTPTAQNIKGPQGNIGNTGAPGVDGKTWLSGTSNPASATGTVGDFYLNRNTWTVFEKTAASTWTNRGIIKGEDGADGEDGAGKATLRVVVGTTTGGWTLDDCDYLCTGTNNDYNIINQAINNLPTEGGEILLLDGDYFVGQQSYAARVITINKDNVVFKGSGSATRLIKNYSVYPEGTPTILVNGANNCTIKNFFIYGRAEETHSDWTGDQIGIRILSSTNILIENTTFYNNKTYQFEIDDSSNIRITNNILLMDDIQFAPGQSKISNSSFCSITNNYLYRSPILSYSPYTLISNNESYFSRLYSGGNNSNISTNIVYEAEVGIVGEHSIISSNTIKGWQNSGNSGVSISGDNSIVIGNTIKDSYGGLAYNGNHIIIANNHMENNSYAMRNSNYGTPSLHVIISNNIIRDARQTGLSVDASNCEYYNISGNIILNSDTREVLIAGSYHVIAGNTIIPQSGKESILLNNLSNNCLVSNNYCIGTAPTNSGTNNILVGNIT